MRHGLEPLTWEDLIVIGLAGFAVTLAFLYFMGLAR